VDERASALYDAPSCSTRITLRTVRAIVDSKHDMTIPFVDGRFEVDRELQLRVNAEQRTGRWRSRIEVADETIPGADLNMTGGAVGAVDEH